MEAKLNELATKTCIKERIQFLLDQRMWTDITFLVGIGTDQKELGAHKFILSMSSPVFYTMFNSSFQEGEGEGRKIVIPDIEHEIFDSFLKYIYTDNLNITSDSVCKFIYVAEKYIVPSLRIKCEQFMAKNLHSCTIKEALQIFEAVLLFDIKSLVPKCHMAIHKKHGDILLDSAGFDSLKEETVKAVINIPREILLAQNNSASQSQAEGDGLGFKFGAAPYPVAGGEPKVQRQFEGLSSASAKLFSESKQQLRNPKPVKLSSIQSSSSFSFSLEDKSTQNPTQIKSQINEFKIFLAACSWITAEATRRDKEDDEELRVFAEPFLSNIRYLRMTAVEFANGLCKNSLIASATALAILLALVLPLNADLRVEPLWPRGWKQ